MKARVRCADAGTRVGCRAGERDVVVVPRAVGCRAGHHGERCDRFRCPPPGCCDASYQRRRKPCASRSKHSDRTVPGATDVDSPNDASAGDTPAPASLAVQAIVTSPLCHTPSAAAQFTTGALRSIHVVADRPCRRAVAGLIAQRCACRSGRWWFPVPPTTEVISVKEPSAEFESPLSVSTAWQDRLTLSRRPCARRHRR